MNYIQSIKNISQNWHFMFNLWAVLGLLRAYLAEQLSLKLFLIFLISYACGWIFIFSLARLPDHINSISKKSLHNLCYVLLNMILISAFLIKWI